MYKCSQLIAYSSGLAWCFFAGGGQQSFGNRCAARYVVRSHRLQHCYTFLAGSEPAAAAAAAPLTNTEAFATMLGHELVASYHKTLVGSGCRAEHATPPPPPLAGVGSTPPSPLTNGCTSTLSPPPPPPPPPPAPPPVAPSPVASSPRVTSPLAASPAACPPPPPPPYTNGLDAASVTPSPVDARRPSDDYDGDSADSRPALDLRQMMDFRPMLAPPPLLPPMLLPPPPLGSVKTDASVLDTADIAQHIREILSSYNIGQRLFAKHVLGLSQGTVSELLSKPKHWDKLTEKGRESYRKMYAWAADERNVHTLKAISPRKSEYPALSRRFFRVDVRGLLRFYRICVEFALKPAHCVRFSRYRGVVIGV